MRVLLIIVFSVGIYTTLIAQFGIGFTASHDLYQRFVNPEDGISDPSAGSAVLNLGAGPKIWVGGTDFSVSFESQAHIGVLGFSRSENKGLGMLSVPVLVRFNFNGLSCLSRRGRLGLTLGGGIQYNKTELYGLKEEFANQGVTRDFFRTYVIQAGYGFGVSGFSVHGIVRYGWDPESNANTLNIGVQYDFNLPLMKKINDPNSAL